MSHRLTEVEQVEGGIAAVGDHHDASVGQPAAQLKYHPARPVGDLLVGFAYLEMVAVRTGNAQVRCAQGM